MDLHRPGSFLDPASAAGAVISKQKAETTRIAKEQERAIHEKLSRNGHPIPKYEFLELIGKGSYGRVFKALDQVENRVVALKVIDVDAHDYKVNAREKDDSIEVTMHEIKVLKQLKDSNTKNVNSILDAFQIHSQLWIVNEYCPGGSVRTLMRGTGDRLENKYIVPIARELAIALKAIHDGGVIHRDVKAANIMIHEKGRLQVIDFGVAGLLQTNYDKRSTVIGTPHWMAPELHKIAPPEGLKYGTEVDVWAYGCTLYEIATGMPPYPRTGAGRMLGITLGRSPPRLDKADYSEGLCDLVAFVLQSNPADRPSMEAILQHPYIKGSEETHPTHSLAELVKLYYRWEHSGGQRQSLFVNAGAAAAEFPAAVNEEEDWWNFSTTANFEKELSEFSFDPETMVSIAVSTNFYNNEGTTSESIQSEDHTLSIPSIIIPESSPPHQSYMGNSSPGGSQAPKGDLSPIDQLNSEKRIKRGEDALKGLFDEQHPPYKYEVRAHNGDQKPIFTLGPPIPGKSASRRTSDLPLRDESVQSSVHRKEFDADQVRSASYDNLPNIDLANVNTIKANRMNRFLENMNQDGKSEDNYVYQSEDEKRATRDWTFPSPVHKDEQEHKRATIEWGFPDEQLNKEIMQAARDRPVLKHTVTAPVGNIRQSMAGMLDLDAIYDDPLYDSDILRTAPVSDDETFPTMALKNQTKRKTASDDESPRGLNDEDTVAFPTSNLSEEDLAASYIGASTESSLISSESDNEYDPFILPNSSDDEIRADVDSYLDEHGVFDNLERATLRREYLEARRAMPRYLRQDIMRGGYAEFKRRGLARGLDSYKERSEDSSSWEHDELDFDPTDSRSFPENAFARPSGSESPLSSRLPTDLLPENLTNSNDNNKKNSNTKTKTGPAATRGIAAAAVAALATRFPQITPPSAESLMVGASAEVVEKELRRLVGDWVTGLEVLGDVFDGKARDRETNASRHDYGVNGTKDDAESEKEAMPDAPAGSVDP